MEDRQNRFIPEMEELISKSVWIREDEDGQLAMCNTDGEYLIISMDEKAHKSNERPTWYWGDDQMTGIPPKVKS